MIRTSWVRLATATAVVVAALSGCDNPFSSDTTRIRLRNSSTFELTAVTFQPGGPKVEFDRIGPGQTTPYTTVSKAYDYGYLDVRVGGERRVIQPIDFVGESPVGEGRFTYVITIEPTTRNPAVQMVRDD